MVILGRRYHRWKTKALLLGIFILAAYILILDNSDPNSQSLEADDSNFQKDRYRRMLSNNPSDPNNLRFDQIQPKFDNDKETDMFEQQKPIPPPASLVKDHKNDNDLRHHEQQALMGPEVDERSQKTIESPELTQSKKQQGKINFQKDVNNDRRSQTMRYHNMWVWVDNLITNKGLFKETDDVDGILDAMNSAPIVSIDVLDVGDYESGTSEKWVAVLEGGQKVMIKLLWELKGKMKPHAACNNGFEIPTAEIAAFHLHRLLGYRNVVYVVGRKLSITRDILPAASARVAHQITVQNNRTCVRGRCFFCKNNHYICPHDGVVEASIAYWIPRHLKLYTYPPKYMPYSTPRGNEWEHIAFNDRTYCNKLRKNIHPYEIDRYYYDIFDFAVLDTLMYHYDSKHYIVKDGSEAHGMTVRLDHGRSFCANDRDDYEIFLAPIFQCCTLRRSTWESLKRYRNGLLSRRLQASLKTDPLAPILENRWYKVIDRRFNKIIITMEQCAKANGGFEHVLVDG